MWGVSTVRCWIVTEQYARLSQVTAQVALIAMEDHYRENVFVSLAEPQEVLYSIHHHLERTSDLESDIVHPTDKSRTSAHVDEVKLLICSHA